MNTHLALSIFLLLLFWVILPGNKNGRASQAGKGNTGAPGDQTLNGMPYTCVDCHDDGAFNPFVAIHVVDSSNTPVSQYVPGRQYIARVTVNPSAGQTPAGYGFQMIALRDNGNVDLDGFTDVNPNNYKLVTISNGRTYAEHPTMSTSDTFNVRWTAPTAGTGSVTFYAAGNAVNGNNNSDGDGADYTSLQLFETGTLSDLQPFSGNSLRLKAFPNPCDREINVSATLPFSGNLLLKVYDLSGNLIWSESALNLAPGAIARQIPTEKWPAGTYFLQLGGNEIDQTVKILKL
ncbi:MAG: T9SS type A sorting domain-containing protein [Saprospiraceae bacterium]|nr:T9SS type A sorting domain-containing protein [Saprospiraceae bacterium]